MMRFRNLFLFLLILFSFNLIYAQDGEVEIYKILINDKEISLNDTTQIIIASKDKIEFFYHIKNHKKTEKPFLFKVSLLSKEYNYHSAPKRLSSKWYRNLPEADYQLIVTGISPVSNWKVVPDTITFRVNNFEAALLKKIDTLNNKLSKFQNKPSQEAHSEEIKIYYYSLAGFLIGIILALISYWIFFRKKEQKMEEEPKKIERKIVDINPELQKENANLKAEIAALRGQIDSLQKRGEDLRKQNKELQKKIDKLSKSKDEIEELQKQKDELFAMVIHDIKNPVSLIKNLVELLRSYDLTATEQQEIIDDIFKTTNKIVSLSQEVSKILALESTKITLNIEKVNMNAIVSDVLQRYEKAAQEKNITIYYKQKEDVPECEIDPFKIDDVIDNLISNAIKFTHPGGKVKVDVKRDGNNIVVEVSDTGQGLTEEDIKQAFKRGAMLSARPTGDEHSSGLGLWIVKKLIDIHKGKIWIKSAVGKGSTFSFSVPIERKGEEN